MLLSAMLCSREKAFSIRSGESAGRSAAIFRPVVRKKQQEPSRQKISCAMAMIPA